MSYQWIDNEEEDLEQNRPATSPQIFPDSIYRRIDSEGDSYRGDLAIVPLPRYYKYKKSQYLGHNAIMLLDKMVAKYKPGQIVSFPELVELGGELDYNKDRVAHSLLKLWAKGYLRKWAEGIWREGFLKRGMGKVGKYYGVHYELLER